MAEYDSGIILSYQPHYFGKGSKAVHRKGYQYNVAMAEINYWSPETLAREQVTDEVKHVPPKKFVDFCHVNRNGLLVLSSPSDSAPYGDPKLPGAYGVTEYSWRRRLPMIFEHFGGEANMQILSRQTQTLIGAGSIHSLYFAEMRRYVAATSWGHVIYRDIQPNVEYDEISKEIWMRSREYVEACVEDFGRTPIYDYLVGKYG